MCNFELNFLGGYRAFFWTKFFVMNNFMNASNVFLKFKIAYEDEIVRLISLN